MKPLVSLRHLSKKVYGGYDTRIQVLFYHFIEKLPRIADSDDYIEYFFEYFDRCTLRINLVKDHKQVISKELFLMGWNGVINVVISGQQKIF